MTPKSAASKGPTKPTAPRARKIHYDPESIPKWSGRLTRRQWGVYASLRRAGDDDAAKAYREQLRATRVRVAVKVEPNANRS
jgi:hypothetical protein